jgi:hypothetical protein
VKAISPLLAKFERDVDGGQTVWLPPRVTPAWGVYFTATAEDEKATVETAKAAFEGKLMTRELAIEKLRGVFQFESAEVLAEELDKQAEEEAEAASVAADADREASLGLINGKPAPQPKPVAKQ